MGVVELSREEREVLLELIDHKMAHIRDQQSRRKDPLTKERLFELENTLTHIIQKLSREKSDLKDAVREDHDELEKTASTHNHDF